MHIGKIKGLDGLRAIAVLMVVLSHHQIYEVIGINRAAYPHFAQLVNPAQGVKIFFVLSGFLITFLLLREQDRFGRISIKQFYMRRILRLSPLYFLAVILLLSMKWIGAATIDYRAFVYLFTYTQNFAPHELNYASTSHLWSLAVEEHFYLVWPFIFMLNRRIAFWFAASFVLAALFFGDQFATAQRAHWTFPAALGIASGCLLAFGVRNEAVRGIFSSIIRSYVVLGIGLIGLLTPWFEYRDYVYIPSVAAVVLFIFFNQNSWPTRILEFKPLALIGVMSYGLYVWHGVLGGVGPYRTAHMQFPLEMHIGLVLTILVVPMSYFGFEKPFLQLKDRFRQQGAANP